MRAPAPRVSVAVTTAGRPELLRHALRSIAAQTLSPDEVVVSEDGADELTAAAVGEAAATGLPVALHRNVPPLGQRGNRQRAFELTRGTYVAMLDDDDEWEAEFLEQAVAALDGHADCGFVSSDHWIIDGDGTVLPDATETASRLFGRSDMVEGTYDDVLVRHLRRRSFALGVSLFRRAELVRVGFFPVYAGAAPDYALFLELGASRINAYYLAQRLGRYRAHRTQVTGDRVSVGRDTIGVLEELYRSGRLTAEERRLVATEYRRRVIEVAIGFGHLGRRCKAFRALSRYARLGWERPRLGRAAVLALLLVGIRPSWRDAFARRRRRAAARGSG